jgi:hypothetical protein
MSGAEGNMPMFLFLVIGLKEEANGFPGIGRIDRVVLCGLAVIGDKIPIFHIP